MRNLIILFIILITLQSCGFRMVDQDNLGNFYIVEIETSGEKRVNHKIKNKLLFTSNDNTRNKINVKINTKRVKNIKEKNIKNEITKYEIFLISKVEFFLIKDDIRANFSKSVTGDFTAGNNYSATINNEKKIVDDLVESLSEKILDEIVLKLNDL